MRISAVTIIALFSAALIATATASGKRRPSACYLAFKRCRFRFAGIKGIGTFSIKGPADEAFTPRITYRYGRKTLGVVNMNSIVPEFILYDAYRGVPITKFGKPRFSSTAFKPFPIPYTPWSGVGHEVFHGNQKFVARGKCVRVYFTEFQLLERDSSGRLVVVENRNNVPKSERKCVVFRTGY